MKADIYNKGLQFKMIVRIKGEGREMADGGFVDWTQQYAPARSQC